ncbi:hypothetical protein LY78DRAFT_43523 [Colletotrichum sublineola]|nr:hypothetical protein LY78DRAFT_43523 [Colletotrichum sublineola]
MSASQSEFAKVEGRRVAVPPTQRTARVTSILSGTGTPLELQHTVCISQLRPIRNSNETLINSTRKAVRSSRFVLFFALALPYTRGGNDYETQFVQGTQSVPAMVPETLTSHMYVNGVPGYGARVDTSGLSDLTPGLFPTSHRRHHMGPSSSSAECAAKPVIRYLT